MIFVIKKLWNKSWDIYHQHEEIFNYIIVGGLTTVVSLAAYYISVLTFLDPNVGWQLQIANLFSWVCAVAFAYVTNRIFVFKSKEKNKFKEITSFVSSRVMTLLLDMGIMGLFVTILHFNDKTMKLVVQVVVTVLNYVLSKLFVFKK